MPLYRLGDLDVPLAHPAIDWDEIRTTLKSRPSALTRLTQPADPGTALVPQGRRQPTIWRG
ncbi:hypothetical protein [Streptomyces sp. NPDC056632]|uniref:hypothetical protein n=1 Tax=Streptomyces sp. NPDC056632 TaxID=3345884 RepID=UPI0036A288CD